MKFLCDQCRAKYQIADEKVKGRALRMKCRRCGHVIQIRADQPDAKVSSRTSRPPSSASRRPPTGRTQRRAGSSPLGAEFRKHVAAPAVPPPAPRLTPLDQWHVAINDVPVGPIRRDELARKIHSGAVNASSLVWREGFDEWRPLGDVAELGGLLRGEAPPRPRSAGSVGSSRSRMPRLPRPVAVPRSNVVPISTRVGSAAPALRGPQTSLEPEDEEPEELPGEPTRVSEVPFPEEEPAARVFTDELELPSIPPPSGKRASQERFAEDSGRSRRQIPVAAWIAMVGAGCFGVALAVVLGQSLLQPGAPDHAAQQQPAPSATESGEASDEGVAEEPGPDMVFDEEALAADEEPEVDESAEPSKAGADRRGGRRRTATKGSGSAKQLSEQQKKLLARMGGGGASGASNIRLPSGGSGSGSKGGDGLDPQQLSRVVSRHKKSLTRCWERAIRGVGNPPRVAFDVSFRVGSSGKVLSASARPRGPTIGNLDSCIESLVRRWTFPRSDGNSEASFPVVFSSGS